MTNGSEPSNRVAGRGVPAEAAAAEAKRLAARRRFLLGGATALPLIVTLGQREAWAASSAVCQSLGMTYDKKYQQRDYVSKLRSGQKPGGLAISAYCDPT